MKKRPPRKNIAQSPRLQRAADELREYNSIEAERQIAEALEFLRESALFAELQNKRLGEFWKAHWPRAPFEEELTLRQVEAIDIDQFLRKKSFQGKKVCAFVLAIRRAAQGEIGDPLDDGQPTQEDRQNFSEFSGGTRLHLLRDWLAEIETLPTYLTAALSLLALECESTSFRSGGMIDLIAAIPGNFSAQDFAILWVSAEKGEDFVVKSPHIMRRDKELHAKIRELFEEHLPHICVHWQEVLKGPGTPERMAIAPHLDAQVNQSVQKGLLRIGLRAFGGVHPLVKGQVFREYWTFDEKALENALDSIRRGSKGNQNKLRKDLKLLIPHFEVDELITFVSGSKTTKPSQGTKKKK